MKGGIGSGYTSSYREPLHEKGVFQYIKLVLIIATLIVGVLILLKTNQITGAAVAQQAISIEDFLSKLTSHPEAQAYVGVSPLNVIQINSNNLPNLQAQIAGLDISYVGSFLVQYPDAIVIYDYNKDTVRGTVALQQPQQASLPGDFSAKLYAHPEAQAYVGVSPLNVVQINSNNLPNLQAQIAGLDTSYLGSFLVQYTDAIVVYDYANDVVKGIVSLQQPQQAALPADFSAKLNAHPELKGLESEQPVGGQLDANSLSTLQQQFPNVYANAKVGDFLLRYSTRLIIYDYNSDAIVNAVDLG